MSERTWSIRSASGALFAATVSVFLIVAGVLLSGAYFLIMASELDEELVEVIAGLQPSIEQGAGDVAGLEEALAAFSLPELETPIAWVVQAQSRGSELAVGPPQLLQKRTPVPADAAALDVWRPTLTTRQTFFELPNGWTVHAVLDGSDWLGRTRLFAGSYALVALVGSLLSLLVGRLFGRRVSDLVSQVAEDVARGDDGVELAATRAVGVPVEVQAVAQAIETRLTANRLEIERSQILVAGLAHDLRAPVQALLTSTQVALLEGASADPRETLQRHLSELRGLVRTVDNIMEWGAPRHQETDGGWMEFHLGAEVRDRLFGEEEAAAKAGVFLDRIERGDLCCVGSPDAILLAIRNLVGNAVDWCAPGGEVSLQLCGLPDRIVVTVEDDGPGLREEEIASLFEPFVRGAAAPGKRSGYGLGLAIVAAVARRHGGTARAENRGSEPVDGVPHPSGARFSFDLPRGRLTKSQSRRRAGDASRR